MNSSYSNKIWFQSEFWSSHVDCFMGFELLLFHKLSMALLTGVGPRAILFLVLFAIFWRNCDSVRAHSLSSICDMGKCMPPFFPESSKRRITRGTLEHICSGVAVSHVPGKRMLPMVSLPAVLIRAGISFQAVMYCHMVKEILWMTRFKVAVQTIRLPWLDVSIYMEEDIGTGNGVSASQTRFVRIPKTL